VKKNNFKKKINIIKFSELKKNILNNNCINLINIKFTVGKTNQYLNDSFEMAFKLIKDKFSQKLINGPINKSTFLKKKYLGITEYISHKFNIKNTGMLIYGKNLSVCPLTTHLPLKLVAQNISKEKILQKIKLIREFYKRFLNFNPKIAILGLNPHCESILNYNEDLKIIKPIIDSQRKKFNLNGPFSADTAFLKNNRKKFDVILGMYHDQVLAPIKALFEFEPINITMGLPFLRITPDHGPNKKMVGKNKSNPTSVINALKFLDKI
jgi:4-hydroxy-L-threonine phosphate dehydrogenase PdxA